MCGLAGAGKTTYAKRLEARGYVRLSVDEEIWRRFGRYGVDYEPERYAGHTEAARESLRERLVALIAEGRDVVIDSAFWQRARRDEYKALIERAGARWRLVSPGRPGPAAPPPARPRRALRRQRRLPDHRRPPGGLPPRLRTPVRRGRGSDRRRGRALILKSQAQDPPRVGGARTRAIPMVGA